MAAFGDVVKYHGATGDAPAIVRKVNQGSVDLVAFEHGDFLGVRAGAVTYMNVVEGQAQGQYEAL